MFDRHVRITLSPSLILLVSAGCSMSDLRPDEAMGGADPGDEVRARGRQLLDG